MSDLISRSALLDYLEHMESIHDDSDWLASQYNADWIHCWLESQPAVDAVEVVRCKDCKHFKIMSDGYTKCSHRHGLAMVLLDNFCSYGERKTDA